MHLALLIPEYFLWHYTTALRLLLNIVSNFVWFTYNFFSTPILLKTFFLPLREVNENYRSSFRQPLPAESLFIGAISRTAGFISRIFVIFFGVSLSVVMAVIGLVLFAIWLVLPFLVFVLIIVGLKNLTP